MASKPVTGSDSLLLGAGYTPSYGINESYTAANGSAKKGLHSDSKERWSVVAYCALAACTISMVTGMSLGFSSILINELNSTTSTIITPPEWRIGEGNTIPSLIGCLMPIGAIFGGLFAWPIADSFGRQAALILGGVPALVGWLFIALSIIFESRIGFYTFVYTGRVLTGFASGWGIYCVSVYVVEVASAKLKGLFGCCNQLFITIGILISYILGIQFNHFRLRFYEVALVAAGIVVIFEILMLFTFETPRWLFLHNKEFLGIRVLKILRGPNAYIMKEIDEIKAKIRKTYSTVEQLKEFRRRGVYHPFILVLLLMFFQQFSGINAAIFFSSTIFDQAGFSGNTAEIMTAGAVGGTQIVATLISVILVDRFGRKIFLVISSFGMMASSVILAVYFYIHKPNGDASSLNYMAIAGVVIFIASFSLGWGPLPWASMGELLPNRVRGLAASMATMVNWTFATIITSCFTKYQQAVTPKYAWGTFAIVMAVSIVFVIVFLPESKGRSVEEIQERFEQGQIIAIKCGMRRRETPSVFNGNTSDIN